MISVDLQLGCLQRFFAQEDTTCDKAILTLHSDYFFLTSHSHKKQQHFLQQGCIPTR
jgi:hypothetical protein